MSVVDKDVVIYSDINQYNPENREVILNIQSIFQSIQNILETSTNSRLFNRDFGSKLSDVLFEVMDDTSEIKAKRLIYDAISRWEPRVELDFGKTKVTRNEDDHVLDLELVFKIKGYQGQKFEYKGKLGA